VDKLPDRKPLLHALFDRCIEDGDDYEILEQL
jgi:hypothetical protein